MLCGSNTFFGCSHFSGARDAWLRRYFTVERIYEVLEKCSSYGVNGVVSGPQPKLYEAIQMLKKNTGRDTAWVMTCGGATLQEVEKDMHWAAEHKVTICMTHPCYTDPHLIKSENRIVGIEKFLANVRKLGMVPGVSTHRPETIVACDAAGYDAETYILPINAIGFLCAVETPWTSRLIRNAKKPVICIKPLAAGRIMPYEGLSYVYGAIKPRDTVAVGFLSPEEAEEDIKIGLEILTGQQAKIALTESRSKATVKA
jgi:hypothetical protein